jgi:hypothetical protein
MLVAVGARCCTRLLYRLVRCVVGLRGGATHYERVLVRCSRFQRGALASCSQVAGAGDRWLLVAVRGHLGDMPVMLSPVLDGAVPSDALIRERAMLFPAPLRYVRRR